MKTTTLLAVALLLILGATAAWAECPAKCPAPVVTCPAPCPAPVVTCPAPAPVCPAPCPPAPRCCPTELKEPCPVCPCPQANPAALGAGPAGDLCGLQCQDFDKAYIEKMYNLNTTIIALTNVGIERSTDKNLRNISSEIRNTKTQENMMLSQWYGQMGFGTVPVTYDRTQDVVASLSEATGQCFDAAYATTLSGLLKQSKDANALVADRGALCQLMQQATTSGSRDDDYVMRLDRWVSEHGDGCTPVCPAPASVCPAPCPTPCPASCPTPCPPACPTHCP